MRRVERHHPLRDLHHVWWPIPSALALIATTGVLAIITALNGA